MAKLTPLGDLPPAPTSHMEALDRHGKDGWDDRPIPRRYFATLSGVEQLELADVQWPMFVRVIGPDGKDISASLWCAPDEATFSATNHGDPAPPEAELLARGWSRPIQKESPAWD